MNAGQKLFKKEIVQFVASGLIDIAVSGADPP